VIKLCQWLLCIGLVIVTGATSAQGDPLLKKLGIDLKQEMTLKKSGDPLVLNGYAIYHRWGQDVYLGVLYTHQKERQANLLFYSNNALVMRFYILQNDINPQMLYQMMIEPFVNNNPGINQQTYDLKRLEELKDILQRLTVNAGDVLSFEYSPKDQIMTYYFNGIEIHHWTTAKSFMNDLLRIWIGQYPPRHEFKKAILNFSS